MALVFAGVIGAAAVQGLERMRHARLDEDLRVFGHVRDFGFTDQAGRPFRGSELRGSVWICDHIFTRCVGPCPMMSARMEDLQRDLPSDIALVSFSVEPEWDTPPVLMKYAGAYGAQPERWHFLTGPKREIFDVCTKDFLTSVQEVPDQPDARVIHSLWFFLVDRDGAVRGHYNGTEEEALKKLRNDAARLRVTGHPFGRLATANAVLNAMSALLLAAGWFLIRARRTAAHKACMLAAVATSTLFLASYLTYHFNVGSVKFPGEGAVRSVYLAILLSHTTLAVVIVPLVIVTLRRAFRGQFERHRRIARWTLPLWLYVSVTGVIVYTMVYHYPGGGSTAARPDAPSAD